jgi:hypothetical protein
LSTPSPTTPEAEKTGQYLPGRMVEQVVGSWQRCAPSTSLVRRRSLPLPVVMQVDLACQRRDVAPASSAPAATTALAGVAVEKGARVWRRLLLVGLANYLCVVGGRTRGGVGRTRALSGATQT